MFLLQRACCPLTVSAARPETSGVSLRGGLSQLEMSACDRLVQSCWTSWKGCDLSGCVWV